MYFVLSGEIRLVRVSQVGGEIILQRVRHGFLAEASIDQKAYHCDAIAAAPTELLAIPRKAFIAALDLETFRSGWIGHLARELRRVRAHAERLSLKTARERVIHYIETEGETGEITLTQPKKVWAAELGLSHEALYRTLAQMEREGEIVVTSSNVRLAARESRA
jgi:CRP-like cAMP-binding protein